MSETLLDSFLSLAANELTDNVPKRQLEITDIFNKENNSEKVSQKEKNENKRSIIHTGDTDSSDDEDNKYYEERKYNEYGRDIKHILDSAPSSSKSVRSGTSDTWKSKSICPNPPKQNKTINKLENVHTDPVFGLRIVNPLVSFTTLQEKMLGREAIPFTKIKKFVVGNISDKNWVIAGVVASKSPVKVSQKGNQFLIWSLSDLKNDIKTVAVFLFGNAYKQLWKTTSGTVVGILNPSVLDQKDNSKDEATLSIDNAQKVIILGQSRDLGTCRSTKKNGERCTAIVNVNRCEYCLYHIKQEYQKCSKRSELQSSFAGKGLTALRNKVLGKNEVFYAGKLYTAIPAKRSRKMEERDDNRLQALSSVGNIATKKSQKKKGVKAAANLEISHHQRLRDLTLLEKLGGGSTTKSDFSASHSTEVTLENSRKNAIDVISKLKAKKIESDSQPEISPLDNKSPAKKIADLKLPSLSGSKNGVIDLGVKITPKDVSRAKFNAIKYIQKNGPLAKSDPNSVKKSSSESKKRIMEANEGEENPSKKQKTVENGFLSDRFKKIMAASSKHLDLLDDRDNEEQEKYFEKLEKKEQMEEKMINTYKVPCKAVRCLQCKYTNFSASQFCKDNKHPLRVSDAVKRFFKCGNCGNRTQSLEVIPMEACKNCGSGKWERTGMMKEKTVGVSHNLSIRGGEQTFINSVATDANLDLLVPDE